MSASQENACLKRMTPSPNATDAAIRAFAGIPALLDQTPALALRGRTLDCEGLLGVSPLHRARSGQIFKQSIPNKQGEHV
jgi:hypothetical protein